MQKGLLSMESNNSDSQIEKPILNAVTQVPNFAVQTSSGSYVSLHELQELQNVPASHLSSNKGNLLLFFFDGISVSHLVYLKEHFERFAIADCNIAVITNQDDERIDEIRAHHEIPFPICKDPNFAIMKQLGIVSIRPQLDINNNDDGPQHYLGCLFIDKYDEVLSHFPPGIEIQKCIQTAMKQLSNSAVNFETLVEKAKMERKTKKKTMTAEDRLALTWWTKYKMYNRKPYKLIVHFTLALLTTFQIFIYTYEDAPYRNNSRTAFNNIFVNTNTLTNIQPDMSFGTGSFQIFSVDDFMGQLDYAMNSYFNLTTTALDHLTTDSTYKMSVTYYTSNSLYSSDDPSLSTHTSHYTLHEGDLGPFSNFSSPESLKSYIDSLNEVQTEFVVHGQDFSNVKLNYDWKVTLVYHFHPRGGTVQLDVVSTIIKLGKNANNLELLFRRYIFISFLIIGFSITSLILAARTLGRNWLSLRALRASNAQNFRMRTFRDNSHSHSSTTFDGARFRELFTDLKVSFLKGWFIITLIASIANILGCLSTIASNFSLVSPGIGASILVGIGCSFSWFNCLRYLESFRSYYTLIVAFQKGLPNVSRLILSALPILIGYTLFGMIVFAELSDNFNSFDHSFAALFSTINGDSLYARFLGVARKSTQYAFMARIYEYTFVCIACYAVVNIFIAIIQEAYTKSRLQENMQKKDNGSTAKNYPASFGELREIHPKSSVEGSVTLNKEEFSDLLKVLKETRAELSSMEAKFLESNDKLAKLEFLLSGQATAV